jgi:dTDP-4-dehydrorhamnose 3,5-epimerase
MGVTISGVEITPLKIIPGENGRVMHGMKATEPSFQGFGEAYFSSVNNEVIKGWKRHARMTLNLVVPVGAIRFVIYDDRVGSNTNMTFNEVVLGPEVQYARLTVAPGLWMAFQGRTTGLNLLLNLASIPHDPTEAEQLPIANNLIPNYNW